MMKVETITYKILADGSGIPVKVYYPENWLASGRYPCVVFIHGGGWTGGKIEQFQRHAELYAEKGFVCLTPTYRQRMTHDTPPQDALRDAKSFMGWLANSLNDFAIDPSRIVIVGGSAGAHLGLGAFVCDGFEEESEPVSSSISPKAFVLFNPVIDNGPTGYGFDQIKDDFPAFSPAHQVVSGLSPVLILIGTKDELIPVETMEQFRALMESKGNSCEIVYYDDQPHGFFNYKADGSNPYFQKTFNEMTAFIERILS